MGNIERVTVNLTPRGAAALKRRLRRGGKDKTAIVNQGLVLADWLEMQEEAGAKIFVRLPDGTEMMAVLL